MAVATFRAELVKGQQEGLLEGTPNPHTLYNP